MANEGTTRKLTALLSADVVGYSRLIAMDEVGTVQRLKSYKKMIGVRVSENHGRVVDSPGDNLLAEFPSALDATRCAIEIQGMLKNRNADLPADRRLEFRIGIHLGDVMVDGDRIYGDGVNIAARLEGLADTGGICISDLVHNQVKNKLDLDYEDIGNQDVKNIAEPVHAYRVLLSGDVTQKATTEIGRIKQKARFSALAVVIIIVVAVGSVLIWKYIYKTGIRSTNVAITEAVTAPDEKPSIIVVPFVNMSPDPEQEYFIDGLTDEIITDLSQTQKLLVISSRTAMTFKGTKKKNKDIAKEVNVRYVLEGSVRKAGNDLRISAQLIEAEHDTHLWADKYSGTLDDIFNIQEKVSQSIVDALQLRLRPEEMERIEERPIENVQAYELYLIAEVEIDRSTEKSINDALLHLQKAIDIVGENDHLYAAMAQGYFQLVNIGVEQEDCLIKAEEYARLSLRLNPESDKANMVLGMMAAIREGYHESIPYFKKALIENHNEPWALLWISMAYNISGKIAVAAPYADRLLQIDPVVWGFWLKGALNYYDGKFDLALQGWQRQYELRPEDSYSVFCYSLILAYQNETDKAISIINQHAVENPGHVAFKLAVILKYALKGDVEEVNREMTPDFLKTVKRDAVYCQWLSSLFALMNEKEGSLNWLEEAVDMGFINYPFLNEYDPFLENIRGEERFKKLMARVKYEWENFEVE